MKFAKKILCLILTVAFIPFLFSCGNNYSSFDMTAFNSPVHIETYSKSLTDNIKNQIKNILSSLENDFSLNKSGSFTYKLKNANAGESISITSEQEEIYNLSKSLFEFSNGKFTPLIYPLSSLWGFTETGKTSNFSIPSDNEINDILQNGCLDFKNIVISNQNIQKSANCVLDFGGMLKGYASEKILDLLVSSGYDDGYVNIGSSSISILKAESLSIRHPRKASESILSIDIKGSINLQVSTSGDYEKYFEYQNQRYSHIIDPDNGKPQQTNVISATIVCENGAFADAMTTALCLMSFDVNDKENSQLVNFINKIKNEYSNAFIFAIYNDGDNKIIVTNKEQNTHFTLLDNSYSIYQVN